MGSHERAPYHLVHCNGQLSAGKNESPNLLIHGDNLLALKAILPYYREQVKCVYIDPPYNTGNEGWVYNDRVDSPEIRSWLGKAVGDKAEDMDRDDKWLCMMHPRLSLLRKFLRPDGAILVSIDDNEVHHLRVMMDQIFGTRNHVATFVWEGVRKNNPKFASISHDYVVCYARRISALKAGGKWRVGKEGLPPIYKKAEELKAKHGGDYAKISEEMREWYSSLERKDPSFQHRHYCDVDEGGVYFSSDISAPGGGGPKYDVLHPKTGKPVRTPSRGWGMKEKSMEKAVQDGRVLFGEDEKKVPTYKRYLHETSEQTLPGVFYHDRRAAMQNLRRMLGEKVFEFPKDVGVLKKFIGVMTAGDDLVLDTFAGSGTTGQAVLELNQEDGGNRRFILVEMDDNICRNVAAPRLSRVVDECGKQLSAGAEVGFRFCELGESLFDEGGGIRRKVEFSALAAHVFFSETGTPIPKRAAGKSALLGEFGGRAVYLLFNGVMGDKRKAGGNVLTARILSRLPKPKRRGSRLVIYGEGCALSANELENGNAVFRHIPYEVKAS